MTFVGENTFTVVRARQDTRVSSPLVFFCSFITLFSLINIESNKVATYGKPIDNIGRKLTEGRLEVEKKLNC